MEEEQNLSPSSSERVGIRLETREPSRQARAGKRRESGGGRQVSPASASLIGAQGKGEAVGLKIPLSPPWEAPSVTDLYPVWNRQGWRQSRAALDNRR